MLYKTLQRMVAKGMTEELRDKIDTLYLLGLKTKDNYMAMVG